MGAIGRPLWPRFFQTLEESVRVRRDVDVSLEFLMDIVEYLSLT